MRISTKRALARFVPSQSSPAANVILARRLLGSVRLVLKPAETSSKSKNVARRCTPPWLDDRAYAAFAATCASLCAVSTSTDEVQFIMWLLCRSVFAGWPHPKQNCCRHSRTTSICLAAYLEGRRKTQFVHMVSGPGLQFSNENKVLSQGVFKCFQDKACLKLV